MTAGELVGAVTARFAAAGVPTPQVDAELLLRHVTGWSRTRLVTRARTEIPPGVAAALEPLVRRREAREPLQLIVGSVGFRYLDVEVRPGVFIPRPETEVLAGEAIARVPDHGVVLEPCAGTGAIACSIAQESRAKTVIATDLSQAAVDLARANARRVGVDISVLQGDLLEPVDPRLRGEVDVIVSNPPYLADGDLQDREPEVVDWEPHLALVSGATGHEVTQRLIDASPIWLRPGGWLLMEVDSPRAAETARRAAAAGLREPQIIADLTGADRIVIARRP